jgi:hypothetical protein
MGTEASHGAKALRCAHPGRQRTDTAGKSCRARRATGQPRRVRCTVGRPRRIRRTTGQQHPVDATGDPGSTGRAAVVAERCRGLSR